MTIIVGILNVDMKKINDVTRSNLYIFYEKWQISRKRRDKCFTKFAPCSSFGNAAYMIWLTIGESTGNAHVDGATTPEKRQWCQKNYRQ